MSNRAHLTKWLYFGCGNGPGHYLFEEGPTPSSSTLRDYNWLDGTLAPQPEGRPYLVAYSLLQGHGCCALAWWDNSGDKRHGSSSTILAPGMWGMYDLLAAAPAHFPWVFARLPQPLELMPYVQP